jgi:hypothetical protein
MENNTSQEAINSKKRGRPKKGTASLSYLEVSHILSNTISHTISKTPPIMIYIMGQNRLPRRNSAT